MQASESTTAGASALSDKGGRDMGTSRTGLRGLLFMSQGKWTFPKTLGLVLWLGFLGMGGGGHWGRIRTNLSGLVWSCSSPHLCPKIIQVGHRKLSQH